MKKTLLISVMAAGAVAANPADYVNFVRQIQADSGVEWDVSVASSGSMLSKEGVGPAGSLFQLWSVHNMTASEYNLDEEFVSAYSPNAAITIQTADPYQHIARTRVDQPFAVRIDVSGLLFGVGAAAPPPAAGRVLLGHKVGEFPEGLHSFGDPANEDPGAGGEEADPYREVGAAMITNNGTFVLNYPITSLRGPDLAKTEGEEVWTVHALEGGIGGLPFSEGEVLESATLQIWPLADAMISGLETTAKYENLPPVTVTLDDLYPDSTTHVRVYEGAPQVNPATVSDIQASYVIIQDSIPQDRILTLNDLDGYFTKPGAYTMEVVHQTPFGVEVLNQFYPLNIERVISIRGSVYSTE